MNSPKILHIAKDEKFINAAHHLFEKAFPGENKFVVIKPPADPPNRYLNDQLLDEAHFLIKSTEAVQKLVHQSTRYRVIVLHGLDDFKVDVFLKSPNKERFMTIVFGAEIYNRKLLGDKLFGPKSEKLHEQINKTTIIDLLKELYRRVVYSSYNDIEKADMREALYQMNIFGSLPSFSYERYIEEGLYNPSAKKVPFTYYPLEFIIKNEDRRVTGADILLGNSAQPTNNHLEAFDILKKLDLMGKEIYAPLSYGYKKYTKAVVKRGKKIWPQKFKPITTFLPLEEYNEIISNCGFVIMNHYRPQAMGNIIASLFMGAKVFLNNTHAYKYFRDLGCHIYLIEEDLVSNDAFELLTEEQVNHNREVLKNELSEFALIRGMQNAFSDIFGFPGEREKVVH